MPITVPNEPSSAERKLKKLNKTENNENENKTKGKKRKSQRDNERKKYINNNQIVYSL